MPQKRIINNPKERKRVYFSIVMSGIFLVTVCAMLPFILKFVKPHTNAFESMHENFGAAARVGFFFSISLYPIYLLLKYKKLMQFKRGTLSVKKIFSFLAKIARQWHVPIGILATAVILIHVTLALINGLKPTGAYISGITTFLLLTILIFFGILRYQRRDKNWHLYLGILFVVSFIIHTLFNA